MAQVDLQDCREATWPPFTKLYSNPQDNPIMTIISQPLGNRILTNNPLHVMMGLSNLSSIFASRAFFVAQKLTKYLNQEASLLLLSFAISQHAFGLLVIERFDTFAKLKSSKLASFDSRQMRK